MTYSSDSEAGEPVSIATIKSLNADAKRLLTEAKTIFDKGDDATPDELETAQASTKAAQEIVDRLDKLGTTDALKTINTIENTLSVMGDRRAPRPSLAGGSDGATLRGAGNVAPAIKSFGQQFTESDAFGDWLKSFAPSGRVPERVQFTSPSITINGGLKALVLGATDSAGGALVYNDQRRDLVVPYVFRPFTVRDIMTVLPTMSDTIEYARVASVTNSAAPILEATSTSTGTKPESAMVFERVTDTIKTIPHWIPATKQVLADAPQLRAMIDQFLRDGIEEELEDQVIAGDGQSPNFTGLLNYSGTTSQGYSTNLLTTLRKARTACRVTGRATANGILMHPNDWEDFDLLQDAEQRYYFGGPSVMGQPRLWGLPVVESEAMTEGLCVLGDFRQCVIWDREQITISVTNSHSDYFIKNIIVILAEGRFGFGILRPAALVEVDLTA
jgi:HK97 family phage major capsid protein